MAAQLALYGGMAALQLASGYFASQNIKATAKLNRDIAEQNAKYAELDAWDAKVAGISKQAEYQGVIDKVLSEQRASFATADVDINYGSASTIQDDTRFVGELNKMEIEKQAQERALGFKRQARDFRIGGAMNYASERARAGATMFNSVLGAAQTGLKGAERAGLFESKSTSLTSKSDFTGYRTLSDGQEQEWNSDEEGVFGWQNIDS